MNKYASTSRIYKNDLSQDIGNKMPQNITLRPDSVRCYPVEDTPTEWIMEKQKQRKIVRGSERQRIAWEHLVISFLWKTFVT